jgi:hypothetical protein
LKGPLEVADIDAQDAYNVSMYAHNAGGRPTMPRCKLAVALMRASNVTMLALDATMWAYNASMYA